MNKLNAIKALNQKLAEYEKQGLTESKAYKDLQANIRLMGLPTTKSKTGTQRISRSKKALESIPESKLEKLSKMPSLREERKKLKEAGIKDKKQQNEKITSYGKIQTWLDNNVSEMYVDSLSGIDEAKNLENTIRDGLRKYDYDTIFNLIEEYEKAKEKWKEELKNSSYYEESDGEII